MASRFSRVKAMASRVATAVSRQRPGNAGDGPLTSIEEGVDEARARLQRETGHGRLIKASATKHGRLIYLANIPLRLQLPPRCENLLELAFRVPPRTSKLEVKKVLERVYGIDVKAVHTLNYDGKKKYHPTKRFYYRTSAYKKAYVVLNRPITLSRDLFPLNLFYGNQEGEQSTPASDTKPPDEKQPEGDDAKSRDQVST